MLIKSLAPSLLRSCLIHGRRGLVGNLPLPQDRPCRCADSRAGQCVGLGLTGVAWRFHPSASRGPPRRVLCGVLRAWCQVAMDRGGIVSDAAGSGAAVTLYR